MIQRYWRSSTAPQLIMDRRRIPRLHPFNVAKFVAYASLYRGYGLVQRLRRLSRTTGEYGQLYSLQPEDIYACVQCISRMLNANTPDENKAK
jgi:hypothetical protein